MGHDHHRDIQIRQGFDNFQHLTGQFRVKSGRRLIKKQDLRVQCQCSRDCHTLALSAGQLKRIGIRLVFESHLFQQFHCLFIYGILIPLLHMDRCICDVFQYGIMRKQIKVLENQPKTGTDLFHFFFVRMHDFSVLHPGCFLSHIQDLAAVDLLKHRRTAKQRGFTGTGRPDDRNDFSFFHRQRDIF